jgi:hypothetical protein
MHAMQARVGGLLVVTGFTLAFTLGAAWAAVGAAMLVGGGIVLAVAAEPLVDQEMSTDDGGDTVEPPGEMAA